MNIVDRLKSNNYKKVNVEIQNDDCFVYESSITIDCNTIKFKDKTMNNTYIQIDVLDENTIHLTRHGDVTMDVTYKSNTSCITTYIDNQSGFKMELETICTNVFIDEFKITINYSNYNYEDEMTNVSLNFVFS